MYRIKPKHRIIAVFLTLNFLTTLLPVNLLYANTNGPKAPEAASFEPVDATDMVNLVTGDFSYVLPLLNVPSPEGGYPLALAYHAGIAMDQEASWVGLGWNLNPGAINRNVNGYPDDYNSSEITEYFYDEGGTITESHFSIGWSPDPLGKASVGLNFSWGSHKAFGGAIDIGYGIGNYSIGTEGVSVGLGIKVNGLTFGINVDSNGNFGANAGIDNNGVGFGVGYSSQGGFSPTASMSIGGDGKKSNALNVSLSSSGIGFTYGRKGEKINNNSKTVASGSGVGLQLAFNNSSSMGDYTNETSGWSIPFWIPTPIGFFSGSFGKKKLRYYIGKKEKNYVSGPLFFKSSLVDTEKWKVTCSTYGGVFGDELGPCEVTYFDNFNDALVEYNNSDCDTCRYPLQIEYNQAFMDMYEFTLEQNEINIAKIANNIEPTKSNLSFPSYDNYNVQAQGLSGNMSSKLWENGGIFGLSSRETQEKYQLEYTYNGASDYLPDFIKFSETPYFQFNNEINTYLGVSKAEMSAYEGVVNDVFKFKRTPSDLYDGGVVSDALTRRPNSNHIKYASNKELMDNPFSGYIAPNIVGFDRSKMPMDGIGAFQITAADGKTYHYSLPVYNHETIIRSFGMVKDDNGNPKSEASAYQEKRQLEPYATHWLLTAVTGPDYVDDGDGLAGEGDLGYWVDFEYGLWSDTFAWKAPYGKDYLENPENQNIKTWIKGRKQLYYLDRVKTRTHTALFVKSQRTDATSEEWAYRSVDHIDGSNSGNTASLYNDDNVGLRFTIPAQEQLKLDKIVLVKNEHDTFGKDTSGTPNSEVTINYTHSNKPAQTAGYNLANNVLDVNDDIGETKAVKVIDLIYAPSNRLKSGQGSLALDKVNFKGKSGIRVLPPYKFDYKNRLPSDNIDYLYNIEDKDAWGYHKDDNSLWSLKEITTPQGGKIQIEYEEHNLIPVMKSEVRFTNGEGDYKISKINNIDFRITSKNDLGLLVNDELDFKYNFICVIRSKTGLITLNECDEERIATVIQDEGDNSYLIKLDNPVSCNCGNSGVTIRSLEFLNASYETDKPIYNYGGIRTKSIVTNDGLESYKTEYKYGDNEDGVGYVSYLPFAPELQEEMPYAQELPAPKVMYEYVTVQSYNTQEQPINGKTVYKFNVIKEKNENKVKYGNFFEIDATYDEDSVNDQGTTIRNYVGNYTIKDNLAAIGQLIEVSTYNSEGHLLNKIVNHYYDPEETPNNIGVTQESYHSYKSIEFENTNEKWNVGSSSTRITYPSLSKGTTEYRDGFVYTTDYLNIDPIVGQATEIVTSNAKGNAIKSKTIPAYTKYPQMGSKADDPAYKNMLTQEAMTISEKFDNGQWEKTGAAITTWYDWGNNVWRKQKNFTWDGSLDSDGYFQNYSDEDDNFDWVNNIPGTSDSEWKQLSEITRYNDFSAPLEVMDINGNYTATKYDHGNEKIIAVCNAAYGAMFYSGAEDEDGSRNFGGDVQKGSAGDSPYAHTGNKALYVTSDDTAFKVTPSVSGTYKVSAWVRGGGTNNTKVMVGTTPYGFRESEKVVAGEWTQLNFYPEVTAGDEVYMTSDSYSVHIDDFRMHPISSAMTSYVYNEWDELAFILGPNNMATGYVYDEAGKLKSVFSEVEDFNGANTGGLKLAKQYDYTYKSLQPVE